MKTVGVHAQIEIGAPPEVVRSTFLDFASYQQWHPKWEITPQEPNKQPMDLQKGDKLSVSMAGFKFSPAIVENTPDVLVWDGALPYVFTGQHSFRFEPSKESPGATNFIQHEEFFGPLVTMFGWCWGGKDAAPSQNWLDFNEALRREAEQRNAA